MTIDFARICRKEAFKAAQLLSSLKSMLKITIVKVGKTKLVPGIARALHQSFLHWTPPLQVADFDFSKPIKFS